MQVLAEIAYYEMANAAELTTSVARLEERVTNHIRFFWAVIGVLALVLGYTAVDVYQIKGRIDSMPAMLAQSLLSQSKKSSEQGNTEDAKRSIGLATALLKNATQNKSKANSSYFESVSQELYQLKKVPDLSLDVHNAAVQLADYKSALQPQPTLPENAVRVVNAINPLVLKNRTVFQKTTPGDFFFIGYVVRSLKNATSIQGPVLEGMVPGVTQTLDGIRWSDTVFINVHIKYEGGEMELRNVTFVNCTFEIVDSPRGTDVTNYIVLGIPQRVLIGATSS